MKNKILILIIMGWCFTLNAQVGLSVSSNGGINVKNSPTHKNGYLVRLLVAGSKSSSTLGININYLRRFAYHSDYNLYSGAGVVLYRSNTQGVKKISPPVFVIPTIGIETRPFRKNKKWVVAIETGFQVAYFDSKIRTRPSASLDFTYFLKAKKK